MSFKIIFYTGYHNPVWSPHDIDTRGLGGTEQCVLHLSEQFAEDPNNDVYVVGDVKETEYKNVKYIKTENTHSVFKNDYIDCVIGVSYINYLLELDHLNFNHSLFWVHNIDFYPWHRGEELDNGGRYLLEDVKLRNIICLSDWHKQKFIQQFPESHNKVKVIGNGVSVNKFVKSKSKIPNSFVYSSHAERGLQKVIDDWDDIKSILPDAILNIATPSYGLDYFNENFLEQINQKEDIFFHGSLSLLNLYKILSNSEYWYYPTEYEETFCITALEMLGHNVKPITSGLAALKETCGQFDLKSLNNLNGDFNGNDANEYISSCNWDVRKNIWYQYVYSDMISKKNIECVYIISMNVNEEQTAIWKNEIENKLLPDYKGHIVIKKATNGSDITNSWLQENDFALYENWKLDEDTNNIFWSRDIDPGALGCAISHYKIWKHAYENKFKNVLILEEDFVVNGEITDELLNKIPSDCELFYFGRNGLDWGDEDVEVGDGTIVIPRHSYNLHGYMLSLKGAESLLNQNFQNYLFPVDEFIICCYKKHPREDLNFITNDLIAYSVNEENYLILQNKLGRQEKGPATNLSHRKHDDLYSYWDEPDEWKKKFISYSARTKEWELIMDEPFDNCFSMPLFTQEFCEKIREEAEHSEKWTVDRHEFYPTTDMLLETISMDRIYYEVLKEFVFPASIFAFKLDGKGWDNMHSEDFLAKYIPNAQGHLSLHHDHSNITALVTLSNFDEYEGGGTYFSHQKKLVKEKQGYVSIHPGNITHKHGARATTEGTRYIIVSFMKNSSFMK